MIAPKIGSLSEIIDDGINGLNYDLNDPNGLFNALSKTSFTFEEYYSMVKNSWELIRTQYGANKHYTDLMEVTKLVVGKNEKEP